MRGLDPRIHLLCKTLAKSWIAGSSPAMTTKCVNLKSSRARAASSTRQLIRAGGRKFFAPVSCALAFRVVQTMNKRPACDAADREAQRRERWCGAARAEQPVPQRFFDHSNPGAACLRAPDKGARHGHSSAKRAFHPPSPTSSPACRSCAGRTQPRRRCRQRMRTQPLQGAIGEREYASPGDRGLSEPQ
jgi:hypothetical protein